jgi:SAM-dependent methyltransferase
MTARPEDRTIGFARPDDCHRASDVFEAAGYSEAAIIKYLGGGPLAKPLAVELPSMVIPAGGDSDLETLMRLFLLGVPEQIEPTRRALGPMDLEEWIEAGLLKLTADRVVPLVNIAPYREWLVACDVPESQDKETDFVMGITGSSLTLANATIRRQSRRTLDIGTGCGIQSFLAAAHSDRVCTVDPNRRAVSLAQFNARLNRLENIDFFEGDQFEPVRGTRFDLIVSNPPFVISPKFHSQYRDGGMQGDQFCQKLVRQVPEYLEEGGFCQILCNWEQKVGQNWQERLAEWFHRCGCEVWVMRGKTMGPAEYTRMWNRKEADRPGFGEIHRTWMEYFEREQIESIGVGLITMYRSSEGRNAFRADDAPETNIGSVGDDIQRAFEAFGFLQSLQSDTALLEARLRIDPRVHLQQEFEPSDEGWRLIRARLSRTRGLGYLSDVDPTTVSLLHHFNGSRTVGEILHELATRRQESFESLCATHLAVLRALIARCFLVPSED